MVRSGTRAQPCRVSSNPTEVTLSLAHFSCDAPIWHNSVVRPGTRAQPCHVSSNPTEATLPLAHSGCDAPVWHSSVVQPSTRAQPCRVSSNPTEATLPLAHSGCDSPVWHSSVVRPGTRAQPCRHPSSNPGDVTLGRFGTRAKKIGSLWHGYKWWQDVTLGCFGTRAKNRVALAPIQMVATPKCCKKDRRFDGNSRIISHERVNNATCIRSSHSHHH